MTRPSLGDVRLLVYRDVRAPQDTGFPVAGTAGDGYLLPAGSQLGPLALDPAEAEAPKRCAGCATARARC